VQIAADSRQVLQEAWQGRQYWFRCTKWSRGQGRHSLPLSRRNRCTQLVQFCDEYAQVAQDGWHW